MKLDFRHIVLIVAVVVGVLTSGGVRAEELAIKQPITIGLDANYAPLQSVGRDGIPRGYDVDFTRALMSRLGIQFYYSPNLWAKVATDVLNGTTASMCASTTTASSPTPSHISGSSQGIWTLTCRPMTNHGRPSLPPMATCLTRTSPTSRCKTQAGIA